MKGTVLEIQRMSTEDGPGLRTTVFMKGCSLNCLWCHNPESIKSGVQIQWFGVRCIGCGLCENACKNNALVRKEGRIIINREKCTGCGKCAEVCPTGAMDSLGSEWEVHKLAFELLKDRVYYEKSGGGITIGGGEPTLQTGFVEALLKLLKKEKIHTAVDSCGVTRPEALERLLPHTDLLLYDLKEADNEKHKKFTGGGNKQVFSNLSMASRLGAKIWIRTPVIPGYNDNPASIKKLGKFIASLNEENESRSIIKWELLAFNNLCADKYKRLGLDWELKDIELPDEELMTELHAAAVKALSPSGGKVEVVWSGTVKQGVKNG